MANPIVSVSARSRSTPLAAHSIPDAYIVDGLELDARTLCVGTSSGVVRALDVERLQPSWSGSTTSGSSARCLARIDGNSLATATANDGIELFDVRSGPTPVSRLKGKQPYQAVAATVDGTQLATGSELVGSDALVELWDARAGKLVQAYTDVASDDVPSLQYAPNGHLLVGSTDGLISVLDPSLPSEEDAVLHVANVGASIKAARWATVGAGLVAQTDMETVELWRLAEDGPELYRSFGDVREVPIAPDWTTDYVVSANPSPRGIDLFLGSNE